MTKKKIIWMSILFFLILALNCLAIPQRLISLSPSSTEILFALGLGDNIVGVTSDSNYPPEATSKPKVGGFGTPSFEIIVNLTPDIVFASAGTIHETVVKQLRDLNISVYESYVLTVDDILIDIQKIGDVTGKSNEAKTLVTDLNKRINAVTSRTKTLSEDKKPKVYFEIYDYWTGGSQTFIYDLIQKAGGINAFDVDIFFFETNSENVINANPDIILLTYIGDILSRAGWDIIPAVKNKRIYNINEDTAMRPGPRIVDSLEEIVQILHPSIMDTNKLKINSIKVYINGKELNGVYDDGDKINDIVPGSKLELKIKIINTDTEMELKDIEIKATIKDIDNGDDIESNIDLSRLSAGKEDTVKLPFNIPLYISEGEYDIEITIKGIDDGKNVYSDNLKLILDIKKQKHNILISKASITPESVDCNRSFKLNTEILNLGSADENIKLLVQIPDLELNREENFIIKSGDEKKETTYSNSFLFKINENVNAGSYPIHLKVLYSDKTAEKTLNLDIKKCEKDSQQTTTTTKNTGNTKNLNTLPTAKVVQPINENLITKEPSFLEKNKNIVLISASGLGIFLILITVLIFLVLPKK